MKILITTGIFVPEIGGPATYVKNLSQALIKAGHLVSVITYSDQHHYDFDEDLGYKIIRIKRTNKIANYWRFFKAVKKQINKFDIIYCFDHFSAAIPSILAVNKIKKIAIRIGGDFIWERYLRIFKKGVTLKDYYQQKLYHKDLIRFHLIKWVFRKADLLIFTTKFQKEIFNNPYNLEDKKIKYIGNPIIFQEKDYQQRNKEILFAGRIIEKNNIRRLIQSFAELKSEEFKLVLIGEGEIKEELRGLVSDNNWLNIIFENKLSQKDLRKRISQSYALAFPSYTDISPNGVLECLSTNTPFILTKEHGFDWLKGKIIEFNPLNNEEIKQALKQILDSSFYTKYQDKIKNLNYNYTLEKVSENTVKLFKELIN